MSTALVTSELTATRIEAMTLDEVLTALLMYGHPRLGHYDKGWYSKVEMFVSAKGVDFTVASEFGHATAVRAAAECLQRTVKTLSEVGK